ncbi:MAG: paraquat-inducible protein A [Chromatiales bacterium]|nr:paraquat-inducible protein A [Chromatiales bacterium]
MSRTSLARRHPGMGLWVNGLLAVSAALLALGVSGPLFSLRQLWIFTNQVSLLSGLRDLWNAGYPGLFALILGFSVLLPIAKLGVIAGIVNSGDGSNEAHRRWLHRLDRYAKWSMLDVFVVALLVVSVKLGDLARVEIQWGLYAFAGSVIATMLAAHQVTNLTRSAHPD